MEVIDLSLLHEVSKELSTYDLLYMTQYYHLNFYDLISISYESRKSLYKSINDCIELKEKTHDY